MSGEGHSAVAVRKERQDKMTGVVRRGELQGSPGGENKESIRLRSHDQTSFKGSGWWAESKCTGRWRGIKDFSDKLLIAICTRVLFYTASLEKAGK